jgi:hypothetical protein
MCRKIVGVLAVLALTVFGVASSAAASAPVGTTSRISVASDGTQADSNSSHPAVSADGRYITYQSDATNLVTGDTNGRTDVFLYDTSTAVTTRISVASDGTQADGTSYTPAISADGRYITYISDATTLVTGDTNESTDVFLYGLPVAPAAAPPALASTGLNPSVPVNISILLVLTGLGAVAVSIYRRRHAS